MSSVTIKEELDQWLEEIYEYDENTLEKSLGKWKRLSKKKNSNGEDIRIFENTHLQKQVMTIGYEIQGFITNGEYVFHSYLSDGIVWLYVSDYKYFQTNNLQSDWELEHLVATPHFINEESEGLFSSKETEEITKKTLLEMGFVEDEKFSKLVSSFKNKKNKP